MSIEINSTPTLASNQRRFISLAEFAHIHGKYPNSVHSCYQIVRDLTLKRLTHNLKVIDGEPFGRSEYFITTTNPTRGTSIIYLPCSFNGDIDLPWLYDLIDECGEINTEVIICVHNTEGIV